ncbi:MAG TPA: hypothetical protein VJT31_33535 [Rugosimonospora sp.]|nr:hypothetical protein [Rugosimonospora sp.]
MSQFTDATIDRYINQRPDDPPTVEECEAAARHLLNADYSFTCECGWSTKDTRYEAHVCPDGAGSVRPDEEPA